MRDKKSGKYDQNKYIAFMCETFINIQPIHPLNWSTDIAFALNNQCLIWWNENSNDKTN